MSKAAVAAHGFIKLIAFFHISNSIWRYDKLGNSCAFNYYKRYVLVAVYENTDTASVITVNRSQQHVRIISQRLFHCAVFVGVTLHSFSGEA